MSVKILVNVRSGRTEVIKTAGYDWATLVFGVLVPIFRGQWKIAFKYFFLSLLTLGLAWVFYVPFISRKENHYHLVEQEGFIDVYEWEGKDLKLEEKSFKKHILEDNLCKFLIFLTLGNVFMLNPIGLVVNLVVFYAVYHHFLKVQKIIKDYNIETTVNNKANLG